MVPIVSDKPTTLKEECDPVNTAVVVEGWGSTKVSSVTAAEGRSLALGRLNCRSKF